MNTTKNLLAGLGGAIALNIIHESLKHTGSDMPRVDLVGEEALQKGLAYVGKQINDENQLYRATLAADLFSNAIYYSFIGSGSGKNVWSRAVVLGLAGGIGAVALPKPVGLNPIPVTKTNQVKILTVSYYLAGALVTAALVCALKK